MGETLHGQRPIVIAHRGASGYRPEHTLAGYELAITQGADFVEPDLVLTADGILICRHDNLLDCTTNVIDVAQSDAEIAALRTTKTVDGHELTGWFAEDLTYAQIGRLRAIERRTGSPSAPFRPVNARFDGEFRIPTFAEVIRLARGHGVGVYPETKFPTHIERETGIDPSTVLLDTLWAHGVRTFTDLPTFIQSFEVGNLRYLREEMSRRGMDFPLIQLLDSSGRPYDVQAAGGKLTYDTMASPEGLAAIARYADGVGPEKYHFIIPRDEAGALDLSQAKTFVADAHAVGLLVHPYTFRAENRSLPVNFRDGDPGEPGYLAAYGQSVAEMKIFLQTGIDGLFTDQPDLGRAAVAAEPATAAILAGLAARRIARRRP